MSGSQTLNSRLRILVAKAYRSEKLYSSVNGARSERQLSSSAQAEIASDARAKEWQRAYNQLRLAANDILSLGNPSHVARAVQSLRSSFLSKAEDSARLLAKGEEEVVETARRHEFAHIFKLSLELIKLKAQTQVFQLIAAELASLLEASGHGIVELRKEAQQDYVAKNEKISTRKATMDKAIDKLWAKSAAALAQGSTKAAEHSTADSAAQSAGKATATGPGSNVVPLRRRVG